MELTSVACNNCGASLQISDSARFITCRYCGAQLEIKRNESTIATEVLQRIDTRTAAMVDDLDALRRESEIERLDREWALRRQNLLVRGKNGSSVPSIIGGFAIIMLGGGFGIFWTVSAASMGAPGIFPLFGVVFICIAIGMGIATITRASSFSSAEQQYQQQRTALLNRLPPPSPAAPPQIPEAQVKY